MGTKKLLMTAIATLAFGLFSQAALAQSPMTNPGPGAAQIVGSPAAPARDLYPVTFVQIDDGNILPRDTIWLEPGKYTLHISAQIRDPKGRQTSTRPSQLEDDDLNEIEVVVEAGKTYHIAALFEGRDRRRPYSTVVHRIEDRE